MDWNFLSQMPLQPKQCEYVILYNALTFFFLNQKCKYYVL